MMGGSPRMLGDATSTAPVLAITCTTVVSPGEARAMPETAYTSSEAICAAASCARCDTDCSMECVIVARTTLTSPMAPIRQATATTATAAIVDLARTPRRVHHVPLSSAGMLWSIGSRLRRE